LDSFEKNYREKKIGSYFVKGAVGGPEQKDEGERMKD